MATDVKIKSAHDGTTLNFGGFDGNDFLAGLQGPGFDGSARVYAYEPSYLVGFFHDLAGHWRGWHGSKEWSSLEGELCLSATCDSTGHINLSVKLRSGPYTFDWKLQTVMLLEAGQLEEIASQVDQFFARESVV